MSKAMQQQGGKVAAVRRPAHAEVEARAYQIYLERGCQPGHEVDDWLQAEYELMQLPIRKLVELEPVRDRVRKGQRRSIVEIVRTVLC